MCRSLSFIKNPNGNIIVVMILRHLRWRADRRAEVSVTSQAKSMFCSLYFIIGWASLLGDRGRSSVAFLIKQGNFSSCYGAKLQLYIMQLSLSLSLSFYCFFNFSTVFLWLSLSLSLSIWKDSACDVDLHVACTAKQKDWETSEGQQLKQQTTAPSTDNVKSLCYWVDARWCQAL